MTEQSELEILANKLQTVMPTIDYLKPWLAKLMAEPESVVIIAIEKPLCPNIGIAWLNRKERLQVRKALIAIRKSREEKGESQTTQIPCH
jgi:hypothetical protein